MKNFVLCLFALLTLASMGCRDADHDASHSHGRGHGHRHVHTPPHGGTPVVLAEEQYHLELVLDRAASRLQAYVLDGHMENFLRLTNESFEVTARVDGREELLRFTPVATAATGEKVGDTSLFEARAAWLSTATNFDATVKSLTIRGRRFENIQFNFPKGNEAH